MYVGVYVCVFMYCITNFVFTLIFVPYCMSPNDSNFDLLRTLSTFTNSLIEFLLFVSLFVCLPRFFLFSFIFFSISFVFFNLLFSQNSFFHFFLFPLFSVVGVVVVIKTFLFYARIVCRFLLFSLIFSLFLLFITYYTHIYIYIHIYMYIY